MTVSIVERLALLVTKDLVCLAERMELVHSCVSLLVSQVSRQLVRVTLDKRVCVHVWHVWGDIILYHRWISRIPTHNVDVE